MIKPSTRSRTNCHHKLALPLTFWLLLSGTAAASDGATPVAPEAVLAHGRQVGAQQAIDDYYDKAPWPAIMKGIASGKSDWLKVYTVLAPSADGGAGEDLGEAIFDALPVQPFKVLPMLTADGQHKVEQACTFSFESSDPQGGVEAYLDKLERALAKAVTPKQREMAEACRRGVQATRTTLQA